MRRQARGALASIAALAVMALPSSIASQAPPAPAPVTVKVDAAAKVGPMKPIWAWFGYDEPNYTYMKDGQQAC